MWPILISLSVAPVSYFFCAAADSADRGRGDARDGQTEMPEFHVVDLLCQVGWNRDAGAGLHAACKRAAPGCQRAHSLRSRPITPVGIRYINTISNTP